jgi:lysozyme
VRIINEELKNQIKRHEGLRLKPYLCPAGKLTIGYGRNLDDKGITKDEAERLLLNDIHECLEKCNAMIPYFYKLNRAQQNVLVNMCYNLGIYGLLGFKRFLAALEKGDLETAKKEMLDSKWANQVGIRAKELADQILNSDQEE